MIQAFFIRRCCWLVLLVFIGLSLGVQAETEAEVEAEAEAEVEGDGESSESVTSAYLQLKPTITANYMSKRINYVRVDVAIRMDRSIMSKVAAHRDPIRDIIIMLLSRQERDTLTSSEGVSLLREEARDEIIQFLESEGAPTEIMDVLFMSFLVD